MGSLQISGPAEDGAVAPTQPSAEQRELKTAFNGRYEILSELGRGAMGVVYKAEDRVIGRTVALKTIAVGREAPDHDDIIERLKSEAKAAGSLDHPNIITIYDVGNDGDRVYLSMQFVEGATLGAMLEGKNLRPGQLTLLSYAEQICNAVAFAHERGVVHRDLKPSNLMLTPQGQIKVLDFGIAKKGDASLTQSGMVVGTPSYMAPEQATGKPVDQRSDIFSLGAVLYELFTGKKAFHADSVTAVLYKVVHEEPELPATIDPSIPPGIEAAIRKALAKDPSMRFQSCVELRDTLRKEAVLLRTASAKILAKPLLESTKHTRFAAKGKSRHPLPILLAACIVVVSAAVVVWPQRSKMPRLMRLISYAQHFGKHQSSNRAPVASPVPAPTNVTAAVGTRDAAANVAAAASSSPVTSEAAGKPESQSQDSAAAPSVSTQPGPSQAQSTPVPPPIESAASKDSPTAAGAQGRAAITGSSPISTGSKDLKSETSAVAAAPSTADQATDRQASAVPSETPDEPVVPKRVRPTAPPAPAVVEGFTRKDIPDLLRKADAATGNGDYKSAVYEYDIVLRLDRVNAQAREGLRRAREAEKERR
ncbi:MAG TPA: protein kinase [Candidatus Dormibacteraeota bacterium]|jgi:serine/threonine protein kinase|nr:protein kinase [Candidatus Dormibacteraeota bacterium]